MNNIGTGISSFGKRLTTRKQRTGMARFAGGIASTAIRKYAGEGCIPLEAVVTTPSATQPQRTH